MLTALLLQLLVGASPSCPFATPALIRQESLLLGDPYLQVLNETAAPMQAADLAGSPWCNRFVSIAKAPPQLLGKQPSTWYRLVLNAAAIQNSMLRVPARGLPQVCVHWPRIDGYLTRCQGSQTLPSPGPYYLFEAPPSLASDEPIFVHVSGGLTAPLPMALVGRVAQMRSDGAQPFAIGLLLGLLLTTVFLSCAAWLNQRNRSYLYFAAFLLSSALAIASFSGYGPHLSGDQGIWFARAGPSIFTIAAVICLVFFNRTYLRLRRSIPYYLCVLAVAGNTVVLLWAAIQPSIAIRSVPLVATATIALLLAIALTEVVRGSRQARYLLGAMVLFAAGVGFTTTAALLNMPSFLAFAVPLLLAGTITMPIVLGFGGYRHYQRIRHERNHARAALLAEQRLALLRANYCRLTGLPTTTKIGELFTRLTAVSNAQRIRIGIYLLHVDNLGQVRQRLGRPALEEAITTLGMRLRDGLDDNQFVGRLDNWELAVVVPTGAHGDAFRERLYEAARNIRGKLQEPMTIGGKETVVSVSVGLAIWPLHGSSYDELLRRCDSALYEAQAAGGNRFQVYNDRVHAKRTHEFQKIRELRGALEQGELELFYQPQHATHNNFIYGLEALLRWHHPKLGLLLPSDFLPLVDDLQLLLDLGYWTLSQAVRDFVWIRQQGKRIPVIAVNVSPRQFANPGFAQHIATTLKQHRINPSMLHLEITEDSLIDNWEQTRSALDRLREIGVRVWVDDFGVGYSSLNYLRALPIHGLKIDRSFVTNVGRSDQDEAVIGAIIRLAHSLGLSTVAEGVETENQHRFLRRAGASALQGHLFSLPLDKNALLTYLQGDRGNAVA